MSNRSEDMAPTLIFYELDFSLIFRFTHAAATVTTQSFSSWSQSYKTFYSCNLRVYLISQSVCTRQDSIMIMGKARTLSKKFYNIGPCGQYYKTFYGRDLQTPEMPDYN